MSWLAALIDTSLVEIAGSWFEWQVRAALFSVFILWLALGVGLRSPITRCAILIIGSGLLLAFPLMQLWLPKVEFAVLPFVLSPTAASSYVLIVLLLSACILSFVLLIRFALSFKALMKMHRSREKIGFQNGSIKKDQCKLILSVFEDCLEKTGNADSSHIELCFSALAQTPLIYGARHIGGIGIFSKSYILLPMSAMDWKESRLQICLSHELWHIKRRDWISQQIASLMRLVLILNPFSRKLQKGVIDGMESCVDKLCVQSGIDSQEYAAVLLEQTRESIANSSSVTSLFSPTFFGDHRYGDSSLQQRIGGLTGEPFGWSSMPPALSCLIAGLLVVGALAFSMITPIKWVSTSLVNTYTPIYVVSSAGALSVERDFIKVEDWPSLQAPNIERLEANYVDLDSNYSLGPGLPNSAIEGLVAESSDIASRDLSEAADALGSSLPRADIPNLSIGDIDVPGIPNATYLAVPAYPLREERRNREGWVELVFDLDDSGIPIDPRIIDSSGSARFEQAAVQAIKESRYSMMAYPGVSLVTEGLTQNYIFQLVDPRSQDRSQPSTVELPP